MFFGVCLYISVRQKGQCLFKMKEKLSRENSVLIVVGYSGNDEHINKILKDCISSGLTIYWFKFKKEDYVPENMVDSISIIENEEGIDTTLKCDDDNVTMLEQLYSMSYKIRNSLHRHGHAFL